MSLEKALSSIRSSSDQMRFVIRLLASKVARMSQRVGEVSEVRKSV